MFSIKINIIYFISFIIIVQVEALDPLPVVEDNNIAITEAVIRNTVNSLFAPFHIKGIKRKPQIQQYSKIHNYFVSITLKDCENLKKIARLSAVNNIDNGTQNYITQINEVLNEGDKSDHVTTYIERFINKLRYLKEKYVSENNTDINKKILKILEDNQQSYKNVTVAKTVSNGTDGQSQNKNILDDNEFWQSSGRRIFEGIRTKIKNFPFMASIHFFNTFQCAGSIIKNDLVITSASCLQIAWNNRFFRENPSFLAVRVGSNMYQFGGEYIPVMEIYFHPQYDPESLAHNLAIMRLEMALKFRKSRKNLRKINFDKSPFPLTATNQITIIGWGARDTSNVIYDPYENRLSYADLAPYPLPECQDHYSKVYVTNRNFCAGFFSKGGGACNHDAGGPGISESKLIGVISFGSPVCGASEAPTVFTKLGYYVDWIESIMEQDALTVKVDTTMWSPMPTRLPFVMSTKRSTRTLIQPVNFPTIGLKDVLIGRMANETNSKEYVSDIDESNEKYSIYNDEENPLTTENDITTVEALTIENALATENATVEWFIKTTTPATAAPKPIEHIDERRDVPNLNMADDELTTNPTSILPIEDQNSFNFNQEEPKAYTMSNEVSTEAATTISQSSITTNSNKQEHSLKNDNIMVLIDNFAIDSGFFDSKETELNDNSQKNEIPTREGELNSIILQNRVRNNPSESVESSYDDDYEDDYDDDYEDDYEDSGMGIQEEPFQNLGLRVMTNKTNAENEQDTEAEIGIF